MFLFSDALFESPNQDGKALETEGVLELTQSAIVKVTGDVVRFRPQRFL